MSELREVKSVLVKRQHIDFLELDSGHWWFEIGESLATGWEPVESYGWYPSETLAPGKTEMVSAFRGVDGSLNGQAAHGGSPTMDASHGFTADEEFHPLVSHDDSRSDDEIAACLRAFAQGYTGNWQWVLGWGRNCHTFQAGALAHCGLKVPSHVRRFTL